MDDLEKQQDTSSILHQALCIISKPSVNSNWSYRPVRLNSGQMCDFLSCVTLKFNGWPWKSIGHIFYASSRGATIHRAAIRYVSRYNVCDTVNDTILTIHWIELVTVAACSTVHCRASITITCLISCWLMFNSFAWDCCVLLCELLIKTTYQLLWLLYFIVMVTLDKLNPLNLISSSILPRSILNNQHFN